MGKNWKIFLSVGSLVVLAGLGSLFALGRDEKSNNISQNGAGVVAGVGSNEGDNYVGRLTKHLGVNGMVLYGSSQSAETKQQKDLFGDVSNDIDYVDCDAATNSSNPDECIGQNITVYPTWVFEGAKYEGIQTLSELAKITDFEQ